MTHALPYLALEALLLGVAWRVGTRPLFGRRHAVAWAVLVLAALIVALSAAPMDPGA